MAIDVVAAKLEQANEIKKQIRAAANTQDVSIPEDAPFADYPDYIAAIPGHLQEKTLTPTAEGVDALPDEEYDGFSRVQIPAEPNFDPQFIAKGKTLWGLEGEAEIPEKTVSPRACTGCLRRQSGENHFHENRAVSAQTEAQNSKGCHQQKNLCIFRKQQK